MSINSRVFFAPLPADKHFDHVCFPKQVHNTPEGHVTRDYKEGLARLSDLRFKVVDTSGMTLKERVICSTDVYFALKTERVLLLVPRS